ncbi:hypothetical protein J6590_018563 [Homalodisca vitripennis]|nr:hypothetical protein J6590_018563 [Homalodisca vitripennis]
MSSIILANVGNFLPFQPDTIIKNMLDSPISYTNRHTNKAPNPNWGFPHIQALEKNLITCWTDREGEGGLSIYTLLWCSPRSQALIVCFAQALEISYISSDPKSSPVPNRYTAVAAATRQAEVTPSLERVLGDAEECGLGTRWPTLLVWQHDAASSARLDP